MLMAQRKTKKDNDNVKDEQARKPEPADSAPLMETVSPFFVVGLGASAGGVEAFKEFLSKTPPDTGAAYVIISHLDPDKESLMKQILETVTTMKVQNITDDMLARPDNVYIIPQGKYLSIENIRFKLVNMPRFSGADMPIDHFLRSLAEDRREMAIGVVLSGMGMDGTLGLKTIQGNMGLALVQEPDTAQYDSMPRSAIESGAADIVAPPQELPAKIIDYIKGVSKDVLSQPTPIPRDAIERIVRVLKVRTGNDFSAYKRDVVERRISRRMSIENIASISEFADHLESNPRAANQMFRDLLIEVTSFFRDSRAFDALKKVLCTVISNKPNGALFKVWVPACLTGEEAYSIGIIIDECMEYSKKDLIVQIFATDINTEALEKARAAAYPMTIAANVSEERLRKYFVSSGDGYTVSKKIRDMVIFAEQNVTSDPGFSKTDLISCRNLLIYMSSDMQHKIIKVFFQSLNPDAILFLGTSETIGDENDLFSTMDAKNKIYRRRPMSSKAEMEIFPMRARPAVPITTLERRDEEGSLSRLAQRILIEQYTPPAVFIDEEGGIVYVSGQIDKYLRIAPGKANMNLYNMARDDLKYQIGSAVKRAVSDKKEIVVKDLPVSGDNRTMLVNLVVRPIMRTETMGNMLLVMFDESVKRDRVYKAKKISPEERSRVKELELEVQYTRQRLQATIEEMQASREELMSMNEEMQSANEELTASKEEMQSLNEELLTVNSELQAKIQALTRTNSDMKNLLDSTNIATIFLYKDLRIRNFTPAAQAIIQLIPSDIGRPITDISNKITSEDIADDASDVVRNLVAREKQIQTVDGRWYSMRIAPYRTIEDVLDGVVLTFSDITQIKSMEDAIRVAKDYAESIINTVPSSLLVLDSDMTIVSANLSFFNKFKVASENTLGHNLFQISDGQWNVPDLRRLLLEIIPKRREVNNFIINCTFPGIGHRVLSLNGRQIVSTLHKSDLVLLSIEDITVQSKKVEGNVLEGEKCETYRDGKN
jgi:two-component system CheB/CheR fusion protein